jgi:WD40 repeat protein
MRGEVTRLDFNNLCEESIVRVKGIVEKAPVKCIRWQPNHEEIFVTASQSGNLQFSDLRCHDKLIGHMASPHNLISPSNNRSTVTGLVFHPSRPELFYTAGTPDNSIKLWDMRKLSDYTSISKAPVTVKRTRKKLVNVLNPFDEFSSTSYTARKHRSSVSLAIDSLGSRLFLATSNDK